MSRMGSAVQWVQENGLENDPKALQKYLIYLNKIKEDAHRKDTKVKEQPRVRNNS